MLAKYVNLMNKCKKEDKIEEEVEEELEVEEEEGLEEDDYDISFHMFM